MRVWYLSERRPGKILRHKCASLQSLPCSHMKSMKVDVKNRVGDSRVPVFVSLIKTLYPLLKPVSHRTRLGTRFKYGILGYTRIDWYEY